MATSTRMNRADWPQIAASIGVLLLYLFYAVSFVFVTPYLGFAITTSTDGWQVNDSFRPELEVGEVLTRIGDLNYDEIAANHYVAPFAGYGPGDVVKLVTSDGQEREIVIQSPALTDRLRRGFSTLWFFPFWAAGTVVLLFLRPRDNRWRLLVAFMYLTAVWFLVGSMSSLRTGGSRAVLGLVTWLMVPIYLHLHLTVPSDLLRRGSRVGLVALYFVCAALAVGELASLVPGSLSQLGLAVAVIGSYALIVYRLVRRSSFGSERVAARLMLAGIGLGFGPGIITFMLPLIVNASSASILGLGISLISIPLLPFFYTYAIYKRQLGTVEFRVSRLLAVYSFTLIYLTVFVGVLVYGEQQVTTAGARTVFLLFASALFVLGTPPLLSRFQKALNRLAYGTEHDPTDILRIFAQRIPSSLTRESLIQLLTQEINPTLLIRQSALMIFEADDLKLLYAEGVSPEELPASPSQVDALLNASGHYRAPRISGHEQLAWVRLPVALVVRQKPIGLWLFGRRDPDDFYPQNDIDLLNALANQIGPVMENIRLYETLIDQADHLAEEVADRTSELREERDRTRAILDSAGEGIFFTDTRGRILYSNPALAAFSGYRQDEMIGRSLELWQANGASDEAYRQMWSAIHSGNEWGGELILVRSDGTQLDVRLKIGPITNPDGELSGFVGVQSDISSLKEIDRVKSNIISSVSHELKTPLTTIKTYLLLLERGKPDRREGYLKVLLRETDRLTNIIEDLLDLSALDTGKLPTNPRLLDIHELVAETVARFRDRAESKRITLSADLPSELPLVMADSSQLSQVLGNLVANALNYSWEEGRVTVTSGRRALEGQDMVLIHVVDTGPGISPEEMSHLFERFYRGEAAQQTLAPGTGLGLSICKEIVERHNGQITVESKPGDGSTFTVWLPAAPQSKQEQDDPAARVASSTGVDG